MVAASSLACARRGWINVDVDKIECESCNANLQFVSSASWTPTEAETAVEDFAKQLDAGHKVNCPWRGNICAESLVQFPPAPESALIGGYKDRCDGLLQFLSLPVVAASVIAQMRAYRGPEIDRFLVQGQAFTAGESGFRAENVSVTENTREEAFYIYSRSQKLISLCGWEPRWLPNVQDCEEHSAQSARNGCSVGPTGDRGHLQDVGPSKKSFSASTRKESRKNELVVTESKCESRSPLLDCSLCGATVRIWDFLTVSRPARYAPNSIDIPETSKKMVLTRGVSAASGISGWVATDGIDKEQMEDHDEAGTTDEGKSQSNVGADLNPTMTAGISSTQLHTSVRSEKYQDVNMGRDLIIGQPSSSEVGDRAASYESRGPSTRKRNLDEGGSTVDTPQLMQQADSIEGTVIDRDGDEVDGGGQYSAGPSKRARDSEAFETYHSSFRRDSSGAGPSHSVGFDIETDTHRVDPSHPGPEQNIHIASTRDSTRASSVIAMDTFCHSADDDSMESVENCPGDVDDAHFPSTSGIKNSDLNNTSELNYSNQAQQSTCPATLRNTGEMGVSSTNDGEEVLNTDTMTAHGRDGPSFGISGGSVGMGASHEAEIHGTDVSAHRTDSVVGDAEPVAEVTENQGQTGEFAPDPGLMGDFVPEEMDREDPHGDSQDFMSRSVGRADSGSKILGSMKAESVESGEKNSSMNIVPQENSAHPSLSCNAILCSGYEVSKEEVTQGRKASPADDSAYPQSDFLVANGIARALSREMTDDRQPRETRETEGAVLRRVMIDTKRQTNDRRQTAESQETLRELVTTDTRRQTTARGSWTIDTRRQQGRDNRETDVNSLQLRRKLVFFWSTMWPPCHLPWRHGGFWLARHGPLYAIDNTASSKLQIINLPFRSQNQDILGSYGGRLSRPPNGESNYEEAVEFDPIQYHNYFCPWVNGNVAAAGCSSSSGSSSNAGAVALCGWQLTLDALDAFQSLGHLPNQTVESESAASLYKFLKARMII
ncbi:unnamed protein product [Thlaspi arvense]|uniref:C3HC-type domain-containing protein n=1 Tax=Thlaspi arvense TaxID=13288 RepID=A0AAU9SPK6_THLAR|nr:unnamed protein product [Thlaspi arvense]